ALVAYDASSFDKNVGFKRLIMLWSSEQKPDDKLGLFTKFCCPTIANGRVYQPAIENKVLVYGLRKEPDGGYNIGFGGRTGLVFTGSACVTEDGFVRLTDHAHNVKSAPYEETTPTFNAGSVFAREPVNIVRFETSFVFRLTNAAANGFTFTIQGESAHAIGSC